MNSSPQAFAQLGRLMWKEYRVQRSLWLALFFLGIVPQVLLRVSFATVGDVENTVDRIDWIWSLAIIIPPVFIVGSAAILFAGEREDRTSDWLLQLAAPPPSLLLAKWGFVLIASLALALTLSMTALSLVWRLPNLSVEQPYAMIKWLLLFVGVLSYGSLGSLLSRRVVTSVPTMGFWWFVTWNVPFFVFLYGRVTGLVHDSIYVALMSIPVLLIAVVDIWLGWRWCQGKYVDGLLVPRSNVHLARLLSHVSGVSRLPVHAELASSWHREWQRLVWQERHRESFHKRMLIGGLVLIAILAIVSRLRDSMLAFGLQNLIVVLPLAMGILGFRYEDEGQPLRFLAQRGVSARFLWIVKHAVWLPRAFGIPLLLWAGTLLVIGRGDKTLVVYSLIAWAHYNAALWFILLSYGCGQLAAMLSRKVLLSIVMGAVLSAVAGVWLLAMILMQVPLWWSVGGVAVWLFAMTWFLVPEWLVDCHVHGSVMRKWGLHLIPPCLLVGAVATWRASEIAGFGPLSPRVTAALHPQEFFNEGLGMGLFEVWWNLDKRWKNLHEDWRQQVAELTAEIAIQSKPMRSEEHSLSERLGKAKWDIIETNPKLLGIMRSGIQQMKLELTESDAFRADYDRYLKTVLEVQGKDADAAPPNRLTINGADLTFHRDLLSLAARVRTNDGQLDEAFQFHCLALRLASLAAIPGPFADRERANAEQIATLREIVDWASHPAQTAEALRQAIRRLHKELALFPSARQTAVAQFRSDRHRLEEFFKTGLDETAERRHLVELARFARYLPWERFRASRILEQELLSSDQRLAQIRTHLSEPGFDVPRTNENYRVFLSGKGEFNLNEVRREFTSPLVVFLRSPLFHDDSKVILSREAVVRQSKLALALLAWKKDHDAWPDALHQLIKPEDRECLPAITIVDPWNGRFFEYNGPYVNLHGFVSMSPLLASVGSAQVREVLVEKSKGRTANVPRELTIDHRSGNEIETHSIDDDRCEVSLDEGRLVLNWHPPKK